MTTKLLATAAALLVAAPAAAQTAPSINVITFVGPNVFGSPNYAAWSANAVDSLKSGAPGVAGTPGTPAYAFAQSDITRADMIVTGFTSWRGQLDPGTTVGPAYANEHGTRALFGVVVNGNGTRFSVAQLSHSAASDDGANAFGYGPYDGYVYGAGNPYGENLVGVLRGADGVLFTGDGVHITGGDVGQLVDGLIGVADGSGIDPCDGTGFACDTDASRRVAIDSALTSIDLGGGNREAWPTRYTGTFSLTGVSAPARSASPRACRSRPPGAR